MDAGVVGKQVCMFVLCVCVSKRPGILWMQISLVSHLDCTYVETCPLPPVDQNIFPFEID